MSLTPHPLPLESTTLFSVSMAKAIHLFIYYLQIALIREVVRIYLFFFDLLHLASALEVHPYCQK